jgi:DNA polymerase I-like protein with 3'-5' exonuclease and polymerase domains
MIKFGVDLETEMADPTRGSVHQDTLLLVTAKSNTGKEYIWDCRKEKPEQWFFDMLEDPTVLKIYHNASFDTKILKHHYGVRSTNNWCTLANERLLWLGDKSVKCGLEPTIFRRYGVVLNKGLRKNLALGIVGEKEKEYALKDVRYLIPLQEDQEQEIRRDGLGNASRIENELAFYMGQMEYYGMPFNAKLYDEYMVRVRQMRSDAARVVWDMLGYSYSKNLLTGEVEGGLNLASQQKALLALHRQGILVPDYAEKTLVTYLHKITVTNPRKRQIIQAILEYKKWDKALSWNYDLLVDKVSGMIHPSYNSLGADTSRTSSSKPNGQNIATEYYVLKFDPKTLEIKSIPSGIDFRKLFQAPEGWKWVGADYSQIELRLYGGIAGVKSIIDEYAKGDRADLHRQAASLVYNKPPEEINKHERTAGKPVNFGSRTFGGGPGAIINAALKYGILLSYDEAEAMRHEILKGDPEGVEWGERITEEARQKGYLINNAGYRRWLKDNQIRETVCRNTPVQGLAGAIGKEGIISYCQWIEEEPGFENVRLISYVHDELNSLAKEEWAEKAKKKKIEYMQEAGNKYMNSMGVDCVVEGYIGDHWEK